MKLDLDLHPFAPPVWPEDAPLKFSWDSETGAVWGRDTDRVRERAAFYTGGTTPHRMQPECWPITDPLHDPVEMAALLGATWILPPELEKFYPVIEGDTPEGAVN